jgi:UDP-glucuronate 4-epimerase
MRVLVTGAAGFVGFHVARALIARGDAVVGVDSVNDYYDPALKDARLAVLDREAAASGADWSFLRADLAGAEAVASAFARGPFDRVIHLAAQAGVRHSLEAPLEYVSANIVAFTHLLEACRRAGAAHLTYASTSSVYGANRAMPFAEDHGVDHPLQFYAATKRANELMAHAYSHLYRLPTTGLRFFTVYGPWGRPDLALFKFTDAILDGRPIDIFNHGEMYRDFTHVRDLVRGIRLLIDAVPERPVSPGDVAEGDSLSHVAPFRIVNIGNSDKVKLLDFVDAIEEAVGRKAVRNYMDMQPGDVPATWADATLLQSLTGYRPRTDFREGVREFVDWFRDYYGK